MDIECPYKPQYGISTHYVDGSYHTSTDNHGMWNHLWKQWWIMMEQLLDKYDICCFLDIFIVYRENWETIETLNFATWTLS